MKSFKALDAVSKVESNLETFKDIGKVCLKIVLLFIIRIQEILLDRKIDPDS